MWQRYVKLFDFVFGAMVERFDFSHSDCCIIFILFLILFHKDINVAFCSLAASCSFLLASCSPSCSGCILSGGGFEVFVLRYIDLSKSCMAAPGSRIPASNCAVFSRHELHLRHCRWLGISSLPCSRLPESPEQTRARTKLWARC